MTGLKLEGMMPPLATPFDENGEVDLGALRENLARYNEIGLSGYIAFGSRSN